MVQISREVNLNGCGAPARIANPWPGAVVTVVERTGSTMDDCLALGLRGMPSGTTVVAGFQERGRGRAPGRRWLSPGWESLLMTVLVRAGELAFPPSQLPLRVGLAVSRAVGDATGSEPAIRWPNDAMLAGRKVAGILTEMNSELDKVKYIIPGIGINVNNRASCLPEEVKLIATTLRDECGADVPVIDLVRNFLEEFDHWYEIFLKHGFPPVAIEWKKLNNTIGSRVKVYDGEIEIYGRATDIDEEGFLLIQSDAGQTIRILSGDVSLRNQ